MFQHKLACIGSVVVLFTAASLADAGEVVVKAPLTFVRVAGKDRPAPGVFVEAPFVRLAIPRQPQVVPAGPAIRQPVGPPIVAPDGKPVEVLPPPKPAAGADGIVEPAAGAPIVEVPMPPPRPPTHAEFASAFRPAAGQYEVVLMHPNSRAPVKVCFTLPPGCPKKVRVERDELEFDYGKYEVEIRFKRDGRVSVEYND